MAAKIGTADRSGFRKSVAMLTNKELLDKDRFRKRDLGKIEAVLRHRGLSWTES